MFVDILGGGGGGELIGRQAVIQTYAQAETHRGRLCNCTSPVSLGNQSTNTFKKRKKKTEVKPWGKGHLGLFYPRQTSASCQYCFSLAAGELCVQVCCRALCSGKRFSSVSGLRWMEGGKLSSPVTGNRQRKESKAGC